MAEMAKAMWQCEVQVTHGCRTVDEVHATCSKCGATITRSQYGRDEECPKCDAWIDWSVEEWN